MNRRDFLKKGAGGFACLVVGSQLSWLAKSNAFAATQVPALNFTVTDAIKEMVTHEPGNNEATCYFWIYKEANLPPSCPGPIIFATEGEKIDVNITNELDEDHNFFIRGVTNSGRIAPGQTKHFSFDAPKAGTYLYYDRLNTPVNRVMGLHGALIVMPKQPLAGHKWTPYSDPTTRVQRLYDDFGDKSWWPGLAWEEGDVATNTPPFRQHVWLTHEASPVLFEEVGSYPPGLDYPAADFIAAFTSDPFLATTNDVRVEGDAQSPATTAFNRKPHFFTINGESGHFAHDNKTITPMYRIGEPTLVRILNAGLMDHSMHLHANHFFVTCINNRVCRNPLWLDVFHLPPMRTMDYTIPCMRPPDIPNVRGIGRPDPGLTTLTGGLTWPPLQEFDQFFPAEGTMRTSYDGVGEVDIAVRQSPLCYPMHDHSEPSQVAQGGNYNCGLMAGIYFIGDRNTPGQMDFPLDAEFEAMLSSGGSINGTCGPADNEPVVPPIILPE